LGEECVKRRPALYLEQTMFKLLWAAAVVGLATFFFSHSRAQTAPTVRELAAYRGLHAAAARGDVDEVSRLVAAHADLNARDANGRTPLHVAAFQGHGEAVRVLLAAGADPNLLDHQRYDAVTIVAVRDDVLTLNVLLRGGASPKLITSPYHGTALIAAAHLGHDGVVRELIKAGAPLDHINNLGWTALMEAVVLGDGGPRHAETVHALLEAGADPGIADRHGRTPLDHARTRGYTSIVGMLDRTPAR
jgi:ankyrin repeat protein